MLIYQCQEIVLRKLFDGIRAIISAFTRLAVFPYPYVIELIHGMFNYLRAIGKYAGFKVSLAIRFHANARTGEICATDIDLLAVKD